MAFKIRKRQKGKLELVSLIDMMFILLVFFLVTSFVIRVPIQERSLSVPTPENVLGRAQIVIQFIDENKVFWLDERVSSIVGSIEQNFGYLSPASLRDKILTELINQNTFLFRRVEEELEYLKLQANENPSAKFFILIRCPNEIPYFRVIDVITRISDTMYSNIKYGCVSGTLEQIRKCRRIYSVVERDTKGRRRKNIRIDF